MTDEKLLEANELRNKLTYKSLQLENLKKLKTTENMSVILDNGEGQSAYITSESEVALMIQKLGIQNLEVEITTLQAKFASL